MRVLTKILLTGIAASVLAACPPPERPQFADITFSHLSPLAFDVAEIRIATPYREPLDAPHVGELFPVTPSRAARRWAEDRLRAVGERGTVTLTIRESSAVETELERTEGLKGLLTKDQSQRYEVTIDMQIEAFDPVGPRVAKASARAVRGSTVPEDATVNEREKVWYRLTEETINALDKTLTQQIEQHLAGFRK